MTEFPLVSIFLITYNQEGFIAQSIESVLMQNYPNFEIIIGDDCSTDNTWSIVTEYQDKFPNIIKAFRNDENLGVTGNSNKVLNRCLGKYISIFAGDDLFLADKISKQVMVMERDPYVVMCYHDVEVFNSSDNSRLRFWNSGKLSFKPYWGSAEFVARKIVVQGTSFVSALSVMMRRDAIPKSGFDERVPVASDWLMWIEVLLNAGLDKKVAFLPEVLARYRRHNANVTNEGYRHTSDEFVTLAIVESKYPRLVKYVLQGYARVHYGFATLLICRSEYQIGRKFLWLSLRDGWVSWKVFYWFFASYFPFLLSLRNKKVV